MKLLNKPVAKALPSAAKHEGNLLKIKKEIPQEPKLLSEILFFSEPVKAVLQMHTYIFIYKKKANIR